LNVKTIIVNNQLFIQRLLCFCCIFFSLTAHAHEFWLQAKNYQLNSHQIILADLRVGQHFKGSALAYLPINFERFEIHLNNSSVDIESRFGDIPAVHQAPIGTGLNILSYVSANSTVVYDSPKMFTDFLQKQGINWVLLKHQQRGLPDMGFTEVYQRFVKSLIAVGDSKGSDQLLGLRFEWLVLDNPYQLNDKKNITAQLLWEGKPFANSQVTIFSNRNNRVEEMIMITNHKGHITLPVIAGATTMLSAVHMVEPTASLSKSTAAVWQSLWASTSFEFPKRSE
jgi:hypothetical protein